MFKCNECTASFQKWQGRCTSCLCWNSITEVLESKNMKQTLHPTKVLSIKEIAPSASANRILTHINEWDAVLGGGIVPGSFLILTGDPGVGKSTMMIQIANLISKQNIKVIYFSSEESLTQLHNKLKNFNLLNTQVLFCEENSVANIISTIKHEKPSVAIIDSLQNCRLSEKYSQNFNAISAIKETAHEIMLVAKEYNIAIIMTGHITKDGSLAGPKLLEHLVDGVFYLQNDQDSYRKILCSVKNRFGAIDEVGFFHLDETGLTEVININQEFLTTTPQKNNIGSNLYLSFKGSRCLLSEFQTLCLRNKTNLPQRVISGIDQKKFLIIIALLEKYLKTDLNSHDIFFKIKTGVKVNEQFADLCIAMTIISSLTNQSLLENCAVIGEINLNGQITAPNNLDMLIKHCKKLGIAKIITGSIKKTSDFIVENLNMIQPLEHVYNLALFFKC